MEILLLVARLALASMFVVAGLAKLADLAGSQQAMRDFGLPAFLATPFGLLLPLAELVVAIALLPTAIAWWGALGALSLLLLFIVGISVNLNRGRTPDCHCFGQLHSTPAGWPTLIRNLILAAIAGVVVGFGRTNAGLSAWDWLGALALAQRIELLALVGVLGLLAVISWTLLHVLRQQGRLLVRLEALEAQLAASGMAAQPDAEGLSIGSAAPTFSLPGLYGETITLDALRSPGKPVVLVFSDPGCGPCTALLPEVGRWQREYAGKLTLALISRGNATDNRTKASEHRITHVLLQQDREVAEAYQASGTPTAVLVRPDGTIGSALAPGAEEIRALVAGAIGLPVLRSLAMAARRNGNGHAVPEAPDESEGKHVGEPAPEFSLPDLSGNMVKLSDFRGSATLLLFWNPGCGFCQRMLDDLKAWEGRSAKGAPRLLIVSTGTLETNKQMGLRSPILLDQDAMSIGSMFGANGTPMAVLIDAQGRIASEVAAGAPAVLALTAPELDTTAPA